MKKFFLFVTSLLVTSFGASMTIPSIALAREIPKSSLQAVVYIECGNRQGSGTIINPTSKFVLTNAHVVMDVDTKVVASSCIVG